MHIPETLIISVDYRHHPLPLILTKFSTETAIRRYQFSERIDVYAMSGGLYCFIIFYYQNTLLQCYNVSHYAYHIIMSLSCLSCNEYIIRLIKQ